MEDKELTEIKNNLAGIEDELKVIYSRLTSGPENKVSQQDLDYVLEIADRLENILK